ncbi:synaptotagmin-5-like [Varanus komodoensis]|uniref:synaptotagmin-5-like n=1 Tax=Varanus komodoensis TaxID=61221 RepID=UPI001CF7E3BB|nr:synaptotagmin-5-like [Varanus komodoensis]
MGETPHLPAFLGAGLSLVCFCLLLRCAMHCHRSKKHCLRERHLWAPVQAVVDPGLGVPSRMSVVAIQQRFPERRADGQDPRPAAVPTCPGPPEDVLRGHAVLPSTPLSQTPSPVVQPPPRGTVSGARMPGDASSLLPSSGGGGTSSPRPHTLPGGPSGPLLKPQPCLRFTLLYVPPAATLTVTVVGVSHLPKGPRASRDSYVKVRLLPKPAAPRRTALCRKSLSPEFREQFHFGLRSPEELASLTLRFAVYAKRSHSLKDSFLGEALFPCSQVAWSRGVSAAFARELSATKTKLGKCRSPRDTACALAAPQPTSAGQLFLLLQYQALASRIKVLVCKAENLGRLTRLPGTPDHSVLVRLYHEGEVLATKETKAVVGYSPVWNAPFLFSIPAGDIWEQRLSLEFTVVQARLCAWTCTVGRVLIGADAPGMGQVHWKEMCSRGNVESARWHAIRPDRPQLSP